jgi:GT2 family glycosyltransferase
MLGFKLKEKGYETYSLNNINFIHYESQSIGKTLNYYKKMRRLFKSKMYYQKKYNKINTFQSLCFYICWIIRNIELLIEIPVRKIMKK